MNDGTSVMPDAPSAPVAALDYAAPADGSPSRWPALLANATLAYPLFFFATLYGEWFLAWALLGHQPRPSMDDPGDITGSRWLHPLGTIAVVGLMPAAVSALGLNGWLILRSDATRGFRRRCMRVLYLFALWGGLFVLLRYGPWPVMEWWLD